MLNFKEYKEQYLSDLSESNRTMQYHKNNIGDTYPIESNDFLENIIIKKNKVYENLVKEVNVLLVKYKSDIQSILCDGKYRNIPNISLLDFRNCDLDKPIPKEYKHLIPIRDKIKAAINYYDNYLTKVCLMRGVACNKAVIDALTNIIKWREYKTTYIDKKTLYIIRELTVTNDIPDKIYRGFSVSYELDEYDNPVLYNDSKFDMDDSYIELINELENGGLKKGDKIVYDFQSESSWSTDMAVAEMFAHDTDGDAMYNIIISYKPKKEDIVADLRDVDLSNITGYHHQLELILKRGKHNFTIEKIVNQSNIISKHKLHYGISDSSIQDSAMRILSLNKYKSIYDQNALMMAEKIVKSNMTFGELLNKYHFEFENHMTKELQLNKLHSRIASYFAMYVLSYTSSNLLIEIESININEIIIYLKYKYKNNNFVDTANVKFKNYNNLFRKVDYEIVNITTNNNIDDNRSDNALEIFKRKLKEIFNVDYSQDRGYF